MAASIDLSAQDDRIVDCLAANLQVIFFHAILTDEERDAAAIKAVAIAKTQASSDVIDAALARLHPVLRDKIAQLPAPEVA